MPKASVNKNDLAPARENDVRGTGEITAVEAVAIAHAVDQSPHEELGFGVRCPDSTHALAALRRRQRIHA